jgi:hypothetical protein
MPNESLGMEMLWWPRFALLYSFRNINAKFFGCLVIADTPQW